MPQNSKIQIRKFKADGNALHGLHERRADEKVGWGGYALRDCGAMDNPGKGFGKRRVAGVGQLI